MFCFLLNFRARNLRFRWRKTFPPLYSILPRIPSIQPHPPAGRFLVLSFCGTHLSPFCVPVGGATLPLFPLTHGFLSSISPVATSDNRVYFFRHYLNCNFDTFPACRKGVSYGVFPYPRLSVCCLIAFHLSFSLKYESSCHLVVRKNTGFLGSLHRQLKPENLYRSRLPADWVLASTSSFDHRRECKFCCFKKAGRLPFVPTHSTYARVMGCGFR